MNAWAGEIRSSGNTGRSWFSADELAAMALPGLPRVKRAINERARDEQWALKSDPQGNPLARRRAGRGGGTEYHVSLLPAAARAELVKRFAIRSPDSAAAANAIAANDETASREWQWFDRQTEKVRREARRRLEIVERVIAYEEAGLSRSSAVAQAATDSRVGSSTLWQWLSLTNGLHAADWLPALAPRRKGGGAEAEIHPEIWTIFKSDWLRPEKPTYAACYRRAKSVADALGIEIPILKTFQRKLEREVDPRVVTMLRDGQEALRRSMPSQRRTVKDLHAMQLVNIDGHKFDVFVNWGNDAKGEPIIGRAIMVAIQDVYSAKFLAWRIGEVESAVLTRLAFADLFRNFGIPLGCLLDNGRAFASKWITGGALTRYRFKIREEDPTGLLPALGINPHWATPYRGQSKPVERAFRDLCEDVAKHPAVAGAYTGNKPEAKPENYGSRAIPIDEFRAHVAQGIAAHNARLGRRSEIANGRSFDQVFAESYATAPIGKATEEQLRLALLAGDKRRVQSATSQIEMFGNRYWTPELNRHAGQMVTVRFDPDDLHRDLHVYDLAGRYLCSAPVIEDTGFLDVAAAKARAKQESQWRRQVREAADAEQLLAASEIAALLPNVGPEELPDPGVIRAVRHRGNAVAALKREPGHRHRPNDEFLNDFMSGVRKLRAVE